MKAPKFSDARKAFSFLIKQKSFGIGNADNQACELSIQPLQYCVHISQSVGKSRRRVQSKRALVYAHA